jgi:glucans biosynthesis protein C
VGGILAIAGRLHFATKYSRLLDSLSANAYGLYLVHYNFVAWPQYASLGAPRRAVATS